MSSNIKQLVSIICPSYNSAKTIERLLHSILNQTYSKIELIIVDDGSTDSSYSIIEKFKYIFLNKGLSLKLIKHKTNLGVGAAINTGLEQTTGDYLCWVDSDDFLDRKSVEIRLEFLLNNKEFAVVSSNGYIYNHYDLTKPISTLGFDLDNENPNQFELLLFGKSMFCPGVHMIRMSSFIKANPLKKIYPSRWGQNWQILLPVYYDFKRGWIDDKLYNVVVYPDSLSRGDNSYSNSLSRLNEHYRIIQETLNRMDISETLKTHYYSKISEFYLRKGMLLSSQYNKFIDCFRSFCKLKKKDIKEILLLLFSFIILPVNFKSRFSRFIIKETDSKSKN